MYFPVPTAALGSVREGYYVQLDHPLVLLIGQPWGSKGERPMSGGRPVLRSNRWSASPDWGLSETARGDKDWPWLQGIAHVGCEGKETKNEKKRGRQGYKGRTHMMRLKRGTIPHQSLTYQIEASTYSLNTQLAEYTMENKTLIPLAGNMEEEFGRIH